MKKAFVWRALSLMLVAMMLLATASCGKKNNAPENTEAELDLQNLAEEKSTPVTLEMVSDFDTDLDGANDIYTLYNSFPGRYALSGAVKVEGKNHLSSDVGVLTKTVGANTYYYLGLEYQSSDYEKVISWEFELPNDGVYDFCFDLLLEDGAPHGCVIEIDRNGAYYSLGYAFENGEEKTVWQDSATKNAYLCGLPTYFAAGKHVIEMRMMADYGDPLMIRNFYLAFTKNQTVGLITLDAFSKTLPERFTASNVIKLDMNALDTGSAEILTVEVGSQFTLNTPNDTGKASANRTTKLLIDGLFHYYLNGGGSGTDISYIRWEFSVPESGVYEVCFNFRLKDDKARYSVFSIDGGEGQKMTYNTQGKRNELIDSVQNSYLTGWTIELAEGDHTLTVTLPNNQGAAWHFRNIYLLKIAN
jgi:hypothetical protein